MEIRAHLVCVRVSSEEARCFLKKNGWNIPEMRGRQATSLRRALSHIEIGLYKKIVTIPGGFELIVATDDIPTITMAFSGGTAC